MIPELPSGQAPAFAGRHPGGPQWAWIPPDNLIFVVNFEVDARWVAYSTLYALMQEGQVAERIVAGAIEDLEVRVDKPDPALA